MHVKNVLAIVIAVAAVAAACGGGEKPQQAAPAAPPAKAAAPAAAAPAAPAGGQAEFGVPECDSYLNKYMACVDSKVPEAARAMMRQQLDQTKEQWQKAAATPQGKAGLAMACSQAEAAAKASMAAYGCSW